MAMHINTNIQSLNAQRHLGKTQGLLTKNLERLSSGKRINSAADGAAALAISEELSAQVRSLSQAQRNTMDGVSMIQTAEGVTGEMSDNLIRMSELAVQASNGTLSDSDRQAINAEFTQLRDEIDRTSAGAEFNGQKLLDGSANVNIQVGANAGANQQINISINEMNSSTMGDGTTTLDNLDLSTAGGASAALGVIEGAQNDLSTARAELGAKQNTLSSTTRNLSVERENIMAANSRIVDVDVAKETTQKALNQIVTQANISVLSQANQLPAMALSLLG